MCKEEQQRLYFKIAVAVFVAVGATAMSGLAQADTEICEYAVDNLTDPSSGKTLLLTKPSYLQTPIDMNDSHAFLSAARLTFPDPPSEKLYIHLGFRLVEFAKTEDEARSRRNLTKVAEHMPLVIGLADGSTLMLSSWGEIGVRGSSQIHGPTEMGNSSDFFRVSHVAGGSYWIDDKQLALLLDQPATMLQVTTTQGDFSIDIHPSRTDRIQHGLSCVSSPGDRLKSEPTSHEEI